MDITSILLTVILLTVTFLLYKWLFTSWNYWSSQGIPTVSGALPIFGNYLPIFRLQVNLSGFCRSVYETYRGNSMVGLYKRKKPTLIVMEPDLIKQVLKTSFNHFHDNESTMDIKEDPLFGRDLLFRHGQSWKNSRAIFMTAFSTKRIRNFCRVIENVCKKLENNLTEKMKDNDYLELDAKLFFSRYATEVATSVVFGINGNSFADDYEGTFLDYMKIITEPITINGMKHNIIFYWPSLRKIIKTRFVPTKADEYFRRVVKNQIDLREKENVSRTDVLQLMLDTEKRGRINRIDVLSHAFSFFLESYETSSLALSAISYYIAKHQEVQSRLRAEVETLLIKYDGQLSYEVMNEMKYMDQVINETSRIYPIAGALARVCTKAYCLKGSDGLTVEVEPGTTVLIPILGLHMDPKLWENPGEFNPERFKKSNIEGRHKFIHLPFSAGPRVCPGQRLAVIEMKAAITTILRNYHIESSPKVQEPLRIEPTHFLNSPVGGFWVKLRPLKNN